MNKKKKESFSKEKNLQLNPLIYDSKWAWKERDLKNKR